MSTPTEEKKEDRHQTIEVKPDDKRNEEPWRSLWWWTTIEIPKKPHRIDFLCTIVVILSAEIAFGFIAGMMLRMAFQ